VRSLRGGRREPLLRSLRSLLEGETRLILPGRATGMGKVAGSKKGGEAGDLRASDAKSGVSGCLLAEK